MHLALMSLCSLHELHLLLLAAVLQTYVVGLWQLTLDFANSALLFKTIEVSPTALVIMPLLPTRYVCHHHQSLSMYYILQIVQLMRA